MGRIVICLFLICLGAINLLAQADDFRVMTFNIRYDNPSDGEFSWKNRKNMVKEVFRLYDPDIVGIQEALSNQVGELKEMLPGYMVYGVGRDDGRDAGEFSAVFFDTTRFSFIEGSTFWLSDTPEVPGSRSWNSACTRISTWVKLHDKWSEKELCVFNTHFDHVSEEARKQSALLILERMKAIADDLPVILTGDFNTTDTSGTYRIITTPSSVFQVENTKILAGVNFAGPSYSYVGFPFHPEKDELIDFIFLTINRGLVVKESRVIDFHSGDKYPSDHLPVIATFSFINTH